MNLRRNLLAAAITSLLCFSQSSLAFETTVTLNDVSRTMEFASQDDANAMVSAPTQAQVGLFTTTDADGNILSPTTSNGLVSQTELNGVPVTTIKVSGAQAVIAQPQADGSIGYLTLSTVNPDGTPIRDDSGQSISLDKLLTAYSAAVTDPANADPILSKTLFNGITGNALGKVQSALTAATTAEFKNPVIVAAGGKPSENTDPAAIINARNLQQLLINNANTLEPVAVTTLTVAEAVPDLNTITQSSRVQSNAAAAAATAATEVNTAIANDPNASSALKEAAKTAATEALTQQKEALTTLLNDPTVVLTEEEKTTIQDQIAKVDDDIKVVDETPVTPNLAEKSTTKLNTLRYTSVKSIVDARADIKNNVAAADRTADMNKALANSSTSEYFARHTAANGIAGNPSSMMNMTADHMFNQAADVTNSETVASGITAGGMQHKLGMGIQYNYYNLAGAMVNTVSLPLSYSAKLSNKSQVILSVPLAYINQNQNDTYQVGAGIALKYNVTDRWTLTPAFSYAYRTADTTSDVLNDKYFAKRALGDGVSLVGGSLSSKYDWNCDDIKVSLTNMGGYFGIADGFGSTPVAARGYTNDLSNFVMKNGVNVGKSLNGFAVSTYLNDIEYFGSELFFEQYNEFGLTLRPENMGALNALSVDANYLFSFSEGKKGDLDGFKVNVNYKF